MKILIRGAGDLATGIACRLYYAGYKKLLMTDIPIPTAVRRTVSFSQAVYETSCRVEGITGELVSSAEQAQKVQNLGKIPVIVDEIGAVRSEYRPDVIVDAIIAKKNTGTKITDAKLVIGIGPGFTANVDCHAVIETKRGHYLGKVIRQGSAIPNTGVPGDVGGFSKERIIRAKAEGAFEPVAYIGKQVKKGDVVARSGGEEVVALLDGIVRGILQPGVRVVPGMKCGDIDPRCELDHCYTVSDKARAIGGGVLEVICYFEKQGDV